MILVLTNLEFLKTLAVEKPSMQEKLNLSGPGFLNWNYSDSQVKWFW